MVVGYDWFQPSDLPRFFHALQKTTQTAILVGGQSLTFWVDYFKIPVPASDTPYLTQDADVLATKHDARIVATELQGTLRIAKLDDHTPNTAIVTYKTPDGRTLFIDFMGTLIGLANEEIRKLAVELEHPDYGFIRILHPTLVLKSRIVFTQWGVDVMGAAPIEVITNKKFHAEHWPRLDARIRSKRNRKKGNN